MKLQKLTFFVEFCLRVTVPGTNVRTPAGHHVGLHERIGDVRPTHPASHDVRVHQTQPSVRQDIFGGFELKKSIFYYF